MWAAQFYKFNKPRQWATSGGLGPWAMAFRLPSVPRWHSPKKQLLMWPLTERLTHFLQGRFRTREEEVGQPQHIDHNVASVPSLAADAVLNDRGGMHRAVEHDGKTLLDEIGRAHV